MQEIKDKIAPGYDADLTIEEEMEFSVTEEILQEKNKITPYAGKL